MLFRGEQTVLMKVNYSNAEPVDHRQIERNIGMAVAAGAAVAVAIVFFVLGPRADLNSFATLVSALLKVAITVVVLIPASIYLIRLTRPGGGTQNAGSIRCGAIYRRHCAGSAECHVRTKISSEWRVQRRVA
jgi:hypothetical protein